MKLLLRIILISVLTSGNSAYARLKYYQYDGDIPFIEMMLNMMTAMGIIDKVPVNYMQDIVSGRYNNYRLNEYVAPPYQAIPNQAFPYQTAPNFGYNRFSNWSQPGNSRFNNNCQSILCGNRAATLNGVWVASNGEMFGIKDNKFLWNDGKQQYLTGTVQVNRDKIITTIDGLNQIIPYQYALKDNRLQIRDRNNIVKVFQRVKSGNRYRR